MRITPNIAKNLLSLKARYCSARFLTFIFTEIQTRLNSLDRNLKNSGRIVAVVLLLILFTRNQAHAATNNYIGANNGNWSTAANWSLGHSPLSSEDVTITPSGASNLNVNVDISSAVCNSLVLGNTNKKKTTTLTFSTDTSALTVTGSFTEGGTYGGATGIINMSVGGTLTCANIIRGTGGIGANVLTAGTVVFTGTDPLPAAGFTVLHALTVSGGTTTLGANTTVTTLTVNTGATLSLGSGTFTLVCSGNLINNGTINGSGSGKFTLSTSGTTIDGTGTISCSGGLTTAVAHTINATANQAISTTFSITAAVTITNNGSIISSAAGGITGISGTNWLQNASTAYLSVAGPFFATSGTVLTASTIGNTVKYSGSSAQAIKSPASTYANLTIANTNASGATMGAAFTVTGTLFDSAGSLLSCGANLLTVSGNLRVNGTLSGTAGVTVSGNSSQISGTGGAGVTNSGTFTISGSGPSFLSGTNLSISSPVSIGAGVSVANNGAVTCTSSNCIVGANATTSIWTNGSGSSLTAAGPVLTTGILNASASTNTVTFTGTENVNPITYDHLTINGGTATISGTTTINTALAISSGTLNGGTVQTLNIGGSFTSSGTFTANTGTVNITSTLTLPSSISTYYNLIVNGGTDTIGGTTTVSHALTLSSGTLNGGSANLNIPGTFTGSGTFSGATGTVTYNGSVSQAIFPASYNNLSLNNSSGFTMAANVTVGGTLTLTSGIVSTGANAMILSSGATISGASSTRYINGSLQQHIVSQASLAWPVGDVSNYTPVTIGFTNITSQGDILVNDTAGSMPAAFSSAPVSSTKYVNRFWTINNTGVAASSYIATFNWVSSDILNSGNYANFMVAAYEGSGWIAPSVANLLSTSIQATNLTGFSKWVIGECDPVTAASVGSQTVCSGSDAVFNVSVTKSHPAAIPAYQWMRSTDNGSTFSTIAGATAASYTVSAPTGTSNGYQYKCVLTPVGCSAFTSTAGTLTVNGVSAATVNSGTVCSGTSNVVFTVTPVSTGPASLSYQWQNSPSGSTFTNISSATASSYTVTSPTTTLNNYQYRCLLLLEVVLLILQVQGY